MAPRQPAPDRTAAARVVLQGLASGDEFGDIGRSLFELREKGSLFPGDVLLELASDALDVARVSRERPLPSSGIRERYLPEVEFRGNTAHQKSQSVLRLAAMTHAGVVVDLGEEVGWWRADDFGAYAFYALVIYMRAAAERTGTTVEAVARQLAVRHGVEL